MHEEKKTRQKVEDAVPEGKEPSYLLDRQEQVRAKILSNMIKQKRKEKAVRNLQANRWSVICYFATSLLCCLFPCIIHSVMFATPYVLLYASFGGQQVKTGDHYYDWYVHKCRCVHACTHTHTCTHTLSLFLSLFRICICTCMSRIVNYILTFVLLQGKWDVPLPKVKAMSEADVFKVVKSGKSKSKCSDCPMILQAASNKLPIRALAQSLVQNGLYLINEMIMGVCTVE